MDTIIERLRGNRLGRGGGIYSVCTANPLALEATLLHAKHNNADCVMIEATSNQVNQYGGYTGMVPEDYVAFIKTLSDKTGYPMVQIALGGDHLGPNPWQDEPADSAMDKAAIMIEAYVKAGFRKIHLDCSMSCQGDPVPLSDETVANRAARLCHVSEDAHADMGAQSGLAEPLYIVGTEVPVPGGAAEALDELIPTTPEDATLTLDIHKAVFTDAGLASAWDRVMAAVVQPGVEFDHHSVVDYDSSKTEALSNVLNGYPGKVFEAHSTDYQTPERLAALVQDGFAILKVGPGVTFALREALWALDAIDRDMNGDEASAFRETVLSVMRNEPKYWRKYYEDGPNLGLDLQYSLSDRIRYYWPHPKIEAARKTLWRNLTARPPLPELVSQYLPCAYEDYRAGRSGLSPDELAFSAVYRELDDYEAACRPKNERVRVNLQNVAE